MFALRGHTLVGLKACEEARSAGSSAGISCGRVQILGSRFRLVVVSWGPHGEMIVVFVPGGPGISLEDPIHRDAAVLMLQLAIDLGMRIVGGIAANEFHWLTSVGWPRKP